jgi:mannose-6-phosphate isomerase-like protein (cupin superfamily)
MTGDASTVSAMKAFLELSPDMFDWQETPIGRYAVWYLSWDDDESDVPIFAISEFNPGAVVQPHHHESDYVSYVVEGSLSVTRRQHVAGEVRFVRAGTVYGPIEIGAEGATVIEVFTRGSGSLPRWSSSGSDQTPYWPEPFATPEEWLASERSSRRLQPARASRGPEKTE